MIYKRTLSAAAAAAAFTPCTACLSIGTSQALWRGTDSATRRASSPACPCGVSSSARRIAATCSGVVPQQPPMTFAPASRASTATPHQLGRAMIMDGPSTYSGMPQLPLAMIAVPSAPSGICMTECISSAGPTPQFAPTAATPRAWAWAAKSAGLTPSSTRCRIEGHRHHNFDPVNCAAFSSISFFNQRNVSIQSRSTPPSARLLPARYRPQQQPHDKHAEGAKAHPLAPLIQRQELAVLSCPHAWPQPDVPVQRPAVERSDTVFGLMSFSRYDVPPKELVRIRSDPASRNADATPTHVRDVLRSRIRRWPPRPRAKQPVPVAPSPRRICFALMWSSKIPILSCDTAFGGRW